MSHVDEGSLTAYLDGGLPADGREEARVRNHLAACAWCRSRLEEAARVRDLSGAALAEVRIEGLHVPTFQDMVSGRRAGAGTPEPSTAVRGRGRRSLAGAVAGALWAASVAVAIAAGALMHALTTQPAAAPARSVATIAAEADRPEERGVVEPGTILEYDVSSTAERPEAPSADRGPDLRSVVRDDRETSLPEPVIRLVSSPSGSAWTSSRAPGDPVRALQLASAPHPAESPGGARHDVGIEGAPRPQPATRAATSVVPPLPGVRLGRVRRVGRAPAGRGDRVAPTLPSRTRDARAEALDATVSFLSRREAEALLGGFLLHVSGLPSPHGWAAVPGPGSRVWSAQRLGGEWLELVQWRTAGAPPRSVAEPRIVDHGTAVDGRAFVEVELPGGQSLWLGALVKLDTLIQLVERIGPLVPAQ